MSLIKLDKKGDVKFVTEIILLIIAFIAILPIITNEFFPKANDINSVTACRNSFLLKAKTDVPIIGPDIDLACKTNVYNYETSDISKLQKLIADELYYCWSQFGEGKIDLKKWKIPTSDYVCFVCTDIKFKESIQKNFPKSQTINMVDYLNNYFIPGSREVTYSEYFLGQKEGFDNNNIRNDLTIIDNILVVYKFKNGIAGFEANFSVDDINSISKSCDSIKYFETNNKKGL